MSYEETITLDRVEEIISYDPETGKFWWKRKTARKVVIGLEAGTTKFTQKDKDGNPKGYRYVSLWGQSIPAARVAWLFIHGEWPHSRMTFADGDQLNLRAENLGMMNSLMVKYDHDDEGERADYLRDHRGAYPMDWKDSHLRSKFGITLSDYADMAAAQGNKCAICEKPETATRNGKLKALAVDHNHATGQVRALLCVACNTGLGKFCDDGDLLLKAKKYLDHHSGASKPVLLKEVT
jgi:hypothetical protein